jgi:phasin
MAGATGSPSYILSKTCLWIEPESPVLTCQEVAMVKDMKFEVPAEMRELAEKSVAQAKQAFDGFIAATQHAVGTAETQVKSMQTGAKGAGELAMRFAERNVTASFEFAQKLLHARDAQEVTALQAEYVKSQLAALTEQAKELSQQATKMTGQA